VKLYIEEDDDMKMPATLSRVPRSGPEKHLIIGDCNWPRLSFLRLSEVFDLSVSPGGNGCQGAHAALPQGLSLSGMSLW